MGNTAIHGLIKRRHETSIHRPWSSIRTHSIGASLDPISLHVKRHRVHSSYSPSMQHNDDIQSCCYINSWIQSGMDQFSQFLQVNGDPMFSPPYFLLGWMGAHQDDHHSLLPKGTLIPRRPTGCLLTKSMRTNGCYEKRCESVRKISVCLSLYVCLLLCQSLGPHLSLLVLSVSTAPSHKHTERYVNRLAIFHRLVFGESLRFPLPVRSSTAEPLRSLLAWLQGYSLLL